MSESCGFFLFLLLTDASDGDTEDEENVGDVIAAGDDGGNGEREWTEEDPADGN